jgi:hypothetical protein
MFFFHILDFSRGYIHHNYRVRIIYKMSLSVGRRPFCKCYNYINHFRSFQICQCKETGARECVYRASNDDLLAYAYYET